MWSAPRSGRLLHPRQHRRAVCRPVRSPWPGPGSGLAGHRGDGPWCPRRPGPGPAGGRRSARPCRAFEQIVSHLANRCVRGLTSRSLSGQAQWPPPGSKNRRPVTRDDVGKTVKQDEPKKEAHRQSGTPGHADRGSQRSGAALAVTLCIAYGSPADKISALPASVRVRKCPFHGRMGLGGPGLGRGPVCSLFPIAARSCERRWRAKGARSARVAAPQAPLARPAGSPIMGGRGQGVPGGARWV